MPAVSGFYEKIVLLYTVAAHFGKRHAEAFGTDTCRFRQDFQHVSLAKSKAAKVGHGGLLVQKLADLRGVFVHIPTAWDLMAAGCSN